MNRKIQIAPPSEEPSSVPSEITVGEMAEYTPSQRSAAQYEVRIKHLREEVKMYRDKSDSLQIDLNSEVVKRARFADIKRGKVEMAIQLMLVTLLSGVGALLMGIYPRSVGIIPPQFAIGGTLVAVGVLLGVFITPITLLVCYVWPKFSDPDNS